MKKADGESAMFLKRVMPELVAIMAERDEKLMRVMAEVAANAARNVVDDMTSTKKSK